MNWSLDIWLKLEGQELYLMIMYGGVFSLDLSDLDLAGMYNQFFYLVKVS